MSTPTYVSDCASPLPCRTLSRAKRSTCVTASPPSRTVPVTHLATTPADRNPPAVPVEGSGYPNYFGCPWVGYPSAKSVRGRRPGRHSVTLMGHADEEHVARVPRIPCHRYSE